MWMLNHHPTRDFGKELVRRMLEELDHLYMIDLLCDEDLQPYYEKLGMEKAQHDDPALSKPSGLKKRRRLLRPSFDILGIFSF
jgi:hypothetical protein